MAIVVSFIAIFRLAFVFEFFRRIFRGGECIKKLLCVSAKDRSVFKLKLIRQLLYGLFKMFYFNEGVLVIFCQFLKLYDTFGGNPVGFLFGTEQLFMLRMKRDIG